VTTIITCYYYYLLAALDKLPVPEAALRHDCTIVSVHCASAFVPPVVPLAVVDELVGAVVGPFDEAKGHKTSANKVMTGHKDPLASAHRRGIVVACHCADDSNAPEHIPLNAAFKDA